MFFKFKLIFSLIVMLVASLGHANTEHQIHLEQGVPYLVVYEDSVKTTQRDLGVHVRSLDSESMVWKKILSGHVLVDPRRGPLWRLAEVARRTDQFESLIVREGRLELINILSHEDDKNSYVRLGQGDAQVIDPVTKTPVHVPQIRSASHIRIYNRFVSLESGFGELVVVSIRLPEDSPVGEGMTVALLASANGKGELSVLSSPILLDYKFREVGQLERLIYAQGGEFKLKSERVLQAMSQPTMHDPDVLKRWRGQLRENNEEWIDSPNEPKIYVNIHGQTIMPEEVEGTALSINDIQIRESYSFTGASFVKIRFSGQSQTDEYVLPGRLDRTESGNPLNLWSYTKSHVLVSIDGAPHLIEKRSRGTALVTPMPGTQLSAVKDLNFLVVGSDDKKALIISSRMKDTGQAHTQIVKIEGYVSDNPKISDSYIIDHHHYSGLDLQMRTSMDKDTRRILFDGFTDKNISNPTAYKLKFDGYGPQIDVFESTRDDLKLTYLRPLRVDELIPKVLDFKKFSDEKNEELGYPRATGLHFRNGQTMLGTPIRPTSGTKMFWDQQVIKSSLPTDDASGEWQHPATATLLVLDSSFGQSDEVDIVLVVSRLQDSVAVKVGQVFREELDDIYMRIIPGRTREGLFSVLQGKRDANNSGYVRVAPYKFAADRITVSPKKDDDFNKAHLILVNSGNGYIVSNVGLDEAEALNRIQYISDISHPFFSLTPEHDVESKQFKAISLLSDRELAPVDFRGAKLESYFDIVKGVSPNSFRRNRSALWKVFKNHLFGSPTLEKVSELSTAEERESFLFSREFEMINQLVEGPPEHVMLVVPDQYKEQIFDLILQRWMNSENESGWSRKNKGFELFIFGEKKPTNQQELIEYLKSIPKEVGNSQKPFLLADGDRVIDLGRLRGKASKRTFRVSDRTDENGERIVRDDDDRVIGESDFVLNGDGMDSSLDVVDEILDATTNKQSEYPHAWMFLGYEGEFIEYPKIKNQSRKTFPILMIVSETERSLLVDEEAKEEVSFGLLSHFREVHIDTPDYELQKHWVEMVLDDPSVKAMNYSYDASMLHRKGEELPPEQARAYIVDHLASQVNELSAKESKSILITLGRVLSSFSNTLLEDPRVRDRRVVDASVIHELLAREFNVRLQPEYMPDGDYLSILKRDDFVRLVFEKTGYNNFKDVGVLRDLILQQSLGESSLSVGSSFIFAGEQGVGKTDLILSVAKTLGLKPYDYRADSISISNNDSNFFFIRGNELADSSAPGFVDGKKLLDHLHHFLTLPNGYRGFIVIDDALQIPEATRHKLLQFIRSLQSLKPGEKYRVTSTLGKEPKTREFSPGNLIIGVTTNVINDSSKIERVQKNKDTDPTLADVLVATLGGEGVSFDHSSVDRFGLVQTIGHPPWAKETRFIDQLTEQSSRRFERGEYFLVSPLFVNQVARQYQGTMNGREFGTKAPAAVSRYFLSQRRRENGAYVVLPRDGLGKTALGTGKKNQKQHGSGINDFVEDESLVLPLARSTEAQLYFLDAIVDAFRTRLHEALLGALEKSPQFSGSQFKQEQFVSWYQQALYDHFLQKPRVALDALALDPTKIGIVDPFMRNEFEQVLGKLSPEEPFFPAIFGRRTSGYIERRAFSEEYVEEGISRGHVNTKSVKTLLGKMRPALAKIIGVGTYDNLPSGLSTEQWVDNLDGMPEGIYRRLYADLSDEVLHGFQNYLDEITSDEVLEYHSSHGNVGMLSFYDMARTYFYVIDKAIARLPWSYTLRFLSASLERVTDDISLKGRPGIQRFLFKDNGSLLRPVSHAHIVQTLGESNLRRSLSSSVAKSNLLNFSSKCRLMLTTGEDH